jgi:hypothetical protein
MSTRNIERFWFKRFKVLKIVSNYGWSLFEGWNAGLSVIRTQIIIFDLLKFRSSLHTLRSWVVYMDLYPSMSLSDVPDALGNHVVEVVFLLA